VKGLVESGQDLATPCAVVSNAGRPNEEVRYLTLGELASAKGISAPAMLIVGEVAAEHSSRKHQDLLSKISSERSLPPQQIPVHPALG
jgi:siroheme synthase